MILIRFFVVGVLAPLSAIFQLYHYLVLVVEEAGENHQPWER
jgi:hypothetical protein